MSDQTPPQQPYGDQPYAQQPGGMPPQQPYGAQPGWQQGPPVPPEKKKGRGRGCLIAAVIILAVIVIGAVSCTALVSQTAKTIDDQSKTEHSAVYEVTGTGTASNITYSSDASGSSAQETDAKLPWKKSVTSSGFLRIYTLLAQNGIEAKGDITCKITVDGKVVKTATAKGAGAIASCNYSE